MKKCLIPWKIKEFSIKNTGFYTGILINCDKKPLSTPWFGQNPRISNRELANRHPRISAPWLYTCLGRKHDFLLRIEQNFQYLTNHAHANQHVRYTPHVPYARYTPHVPHVRYTPHAAHPWDTPHAWDTSHVFHWRIKRKIIINTKLPSRNFDE